MTPRHAATAPMVRFVVTLAEEPEISVALV
jgi:hypothetical protein